MTPQEKFAEKISSFLPLIDILVHETNIEELKEWQRGMEDRAHQQESIGVMFDFDALEKADITKLKNNVFTALIKLIEARKIQIEEEPKLRAGMGKREEIAKNLGL